MAKRVSIPGAMKFGQDIGTILETKLALEGELDKVLSPNMNSDHYNRYFTHKRKSHDGAVYEIKARALEDIITQFKSLFRSELYKIFNEDGVTNILFDLHSNPKTKWVLGYMLGSMLHEATCLELTEAKQFLVSCYNKGGSYLTHLASGTGDIITLQELLAAKADVNQKSLDGYSPLYTAMHRENFKTVQFLLEAKADVNAKSPDDETSLLKIARPGLTPYTDVIFPLLEQAATEQQEAVSSHANILGVVQSNAW